MLKSVSQKTFSSTRQVQRKQKELANVENKESQHKERNSAVTEHLKDVQQGRTHTQVKEMLKNHVPCLTRTAVSFLKKNKQTVELLFIDMSPCRLCAGLSRSSLSPSCISTPWPRERRDGCFRRSRSWRMS